MRRNCQIQEAAYLGRHGKITAAQLWWEESASSRSPANARLCSTGVNWSSEGFWRWKKKEEEETPDVAIQPAPWLTRGVVSFPGYYFYVIFVGLGCFTGFVPFCEPRTVMCMRWLAHKFMKVTTEQPLKSYISPILLNRTEKITAPPMRKDSNSWLQISFPEFPQEAPSKKRKTEYFHAG